MPAFLGMKTTVSASELTYYPNEVSKAKHINTTANANQYLLRGSIHKYTTEHLTSIHKPPTKPHLHHTEVKIKRKICVFILSTEDLHQPSTLNTQQISSLHTTRIPLNPRKPANTYFITLHILGSGKPQDHDQDQIDPGVDGKNHR
jgi:hypothetical protein